MQNIQNSKEKFNSGHCCYYRKTKEGQVIASKKGALLCIYNLLVLSH